MKYYFILGRNPELSIAEIESVFAMEKIEYSIHKNYKNVLILETKKILDGDGLLSRLGGTIKIGEIKKEVKTIEEVREAFLYDFDIPEGKVFFGFSLYSINELVNVRHYVGKLKHVGMEIKKALSEGGQSSRLVVSKDPELSSVIVKKEKLLL